MTGYQIGTGNRMTNDGVYTYTYDTEGNITKKSKGATQETSFYTYDHNNQLTVAEKRAEDNHTSTLQMLATYTYDALTQRVQKAVFDGSTTTTERFAYDLGKGQLSDAWADLDGSSSLTSRRVYGDGVDEPLSRLVGTTVVHFLTDRLGSVREIANNSTGAFIYEVSYNGFGNVLSEVNPTNRDRIAFAGYWFDAEVSLYDVRRRKYDAATGQWLQEDPSGLEDDDRPRGYVKNNPVMFVDPSGLAAQNPLNQAVNAVGAIAGALAGVPGAGFGVVGPVAGALAPVDDPADLPPPEVLPPVAGGAGGGAPPLAFLPPWWNIWPFFFPPPRPQLPFRPQWVMFFPQGAPNLPPQPVNGNPTGPGPSLDGNPPPGEWICELVSINKRTGEEMGAIFLHFGRCEPEDLQPVAFLGGEQQEPRERGEIWGPNVVPDTSEYSYRLLDSAAVNIQWKTDDPRAASLISGGPNGKFRFGDVSRRLQIWAEYDSATKAGNVEHIKSKPFTVDVVKITVTGAGSSALQTAYYRFGVMNQQPFPRIPSILMTIVRTFPDAPFRWWAKIGEAHDSANPVNVGAIEVGVIQHVRVVDWRASYWGGGVWVNSNEGSKLYLDVDRNHSTPPFYEPEEPLLSGGMTIGGADWPHSYVPAQRNERGVRHQDIVSVFTMDVVARTNADPFQSLLLWKQATTTWTLDLSGYITSAYVYGHLKRDGKVYTFSNRWDQTITPAQPDTRGPLANDVLNWGWAPGSSAEDLGD